MAAARYGRLAPVACWPPHVPKRSFHTPPAGRMVGDAPFAFDLPRSKKIFPVLSGQVETDSQPTETLLDRSASARLRQQCRGVALQDMP